MKVTDRCYRSFVWFIDTHFFYIKKILFLFSLNLTHIFRKPDKNKNTL